MLFALQLWQQMVENKNAAKRKTRDFTLMQEILWNLLSSSNFSFGFMKSIIHLFSVTLRTKVSCIFYVVFFVQCDPGKKND